MRECSIDIFNECIPYFEILKDTQRQEIVINLVKNKELNVSELVELSNLSMPAVAHHLKLMSQSGIVTSTKRGTKRYYRLSMDDAIEKLERLLISLKEMVNEGEQ